MAHNEVAFRYGQAHRQRPEGFVPTAMDGYFGPRILSAWPFRHWADTAGRVSARIHEVGCGRGTYPFWKTENDKVSGVDCDAGGRVGQRAGINCTTHDRPAAVLAGQPYLDLRGSCGLFRNRCLSRQGRSLEGSWLCGIRMAVVHNEDR